MNFRYNSFYVLRFFSRALFGRNFLIRNRSAQMIYSFLRSIIKFFSPDHRKQIRWEKSNPDAPWLVPESISFLEDWLTKNMNGFEFGSGRSTKWFSQRVNYYFSVEGNIEWYRKVKQQNKKNISNGRCEIIFRDVGDEINIDAKKIKLYSNSLSKFENKFFDFGLIDGHFRLDCINNSLKKIKPDGILIVDNSDAIDGIETIKKRYQYKIFTNGVSETSIFYIS
mgnify:CR=1 FL=1